MRHRGSDTPILQAVLAVQLTFDKLLIPPGSYIPELFLHICKTPCFPVHGPIFFLQ